MNNNFKNRSLIMCGPVFESQKEISVDCANCSVECEIKGGDIQCPYEKKE